MRSPTGHSVLWIKDNFYSLHLNAFLTVSCLERDRAGVNTVFKTLWATINLNYISGPKKQKGVSPIVSYFS